MKHYQIIFSPTGGTERVSKAITQNWFQIDTIDLSDPGTNYTDISFDKDSLVLIAMPSFGGVAPQLALDRLAMIKGDGAKCVIAAVYGNRAYEDTLVQMEDYAQNAGFQVIAAISAVAEHSIIHEYAAGRPNVDDCKKLTEFGDQILEKATSNQLSKPSVPGNRPYKKAGTGMVPKADSSCTSCGLCAQKCPASAISSITPGATDKGKCISCMRCVSICPVHARKVSSVMTAVAAVAIKKACSVEKANELFI
ncbi:4Fe-4S binding protein [Dysosmobacter sp.]|jgi:ferredoxin|uniref:4Fe-4S binding protein n=1 Tax=Dysosmobacter sp. TaxID=2591382 RepID=UPI003D91690A